jgi:hypothetical protein
VRSGTVSVIFHSAAPGDKGALATGDGRFSLDATGDYLVVTASAAELDGMEKVVAGFAGQATDGERVAERVHERFKTAAIAVLPATD